MKTYRIAVCGPPRSGKRFLMKALLHHTKSGTYSWEGTDERVIRYWSIETLHCTYSFLSISGLHMDKAFLDTVKDADLVLYVSHAVFSKGRTINAIAEQDFLYLKGMSILAQHVHRDWNSIPWISVLTKSDVGDASLTDTVIPLLHQKELIRVSAVRGDGINTLWDCIVQVSTRENEAS